MSKVEIKLTLDEDGEVDSDILTTMRYFMPRLTSIFLASSFPEDATMSDMAKAMLHCFASDSEAFEAYLDGMDEWNEDHAESEEDHAEESQAPADSIAKEGKQEPAIRVVCGNGRNALRTYDAIDLLQEAIEELERDGSENRHVVRDIVVDIYSGTVAIYLAQNK